VLASTMYGRDLDSLAAISRLSRTHSIGDRNRVDSSRLYTYSIRMKKKLTITVDEKVYAGLHRVVGRGKISDFIETLVTPQVLQQDLTAGYLQMAADEVREAEAAEWAESTIVDVADEPR